MNFPVVAMESLTHDLELLSPDARALMGLLALLTTESERYPLGGLLAPFRLWPGETTITGGSPAEPSLTPLHLTSLSLLNPLDLMVGVSLASWTVSLYGPRQLHNIHPFGAKWP